MSAAHFKLIDWSRTLRRSVAAVLCLLLLIAAHSALAHAGCERPAEPSLSDATPCDHDHPSAPETPAHSGSDHNQACCKCPCHAVRGMLSFASPIILSASVPSGFPHLVNDPARDGPPSEIFQPPKLPR